MACASCNRNKAKIPQVFTSLQNQYPFNANDIQVVANGEVNKFQVSYWDNDKHKLLIFIPQAFTPVCETELGAMSKWYEEFKKLDCELIAVCTDPAGMLLDWQNDEPLLRDAPYKMFSSYLLPTRLSIIDNGRSKRASVFITNDGEIVKQEHFSKVGRSFKELHRMLWAYTQDTFCGEGWQDPTDNLE